MQILILAAGMGRRLAELTNEFTKCMVKVNGIPLINRALDVLVEYKPERIVLVIGYQGEKLKEYIGSDYKGIKVLYINNPVFNSTNNIYSLFLAKDELCEKDTLLLESDLIFDKSIIDRVYSKRELDNCVVIDKHQSWMDGTVVKINQRGEIIRFVSKDDFDFNDKDDYFKTVNIYWFRKEFSKSHYVPFLEAYCKSVGHNEYYENVLKVLAFLDVQKLNTCILDEGDKWYEIDDKQDLHNAETLFSNSVKSYQNRYGGYWRFPFLKDFCYLVNPYFPPKKMVEEFKANFEILLHDYPSTGTVQSLLAAKMFNCDPCNVLVGNGAAELISCLMGSFTDRRVGVIIPTFHEYVARVPSENLICFSIKNDDFKYDLKDLEKFAEQVDVLLLINPDNPSGNFIPKVKLLELLDYMEKSNKTLVLDESFVDFSTESYRNSMISREVISRHKDLFIVKSISKSYGVPGIRLGVLVSANCEYLEAIRAKLPVWNINSYGEFFLQIYGKYENNYFEACIDIATERDRLYSELCQIDFLRPIYSQANYFLCEVLDGPATLLTKRLMKEYNVLLKDCTGKTGFDGKEFVRIAVRNSSDNDYLINSLKRIGNVKDINS